MEDHLNNLTEGNYGMGITRTKPTVHNSPKRRANEEYTLLQIARDPRPIIPARNPKVEDISDEEDEDIELPPPPMAKRPTVSLQQLDVISDPQFYTFAKEFRTNIVHV